MANTRKTRSNRRSASRRANRRVNRRASRRMNRKTNMYGGAPLVLSPMELTDTSMAGPGKLSIAQGIDFAGKHAAQHGGAALVGAPVGETGVLEQSLRSYAHLDPLDASYKAVVGMKDQSGGKRRGSRKVKRGGRRSSRRSSRRSARRASRRQSGGVRPELEFAPSNAPGMLLSGSLANQALNTMNGEWQLAKDPSAFAPKA